MKKKKKNLCLFAFLYYKKKLCSLSLFVFKFFQISPRSHCPRRTYPTASGVLISSISSSLVSFLFFGEDFVVSSWIELGVLFSSGGAYGRALLEFGFWFVGGTHQC